jgi:hypothetical protein
MSGTLIATFSAFWLSVLAKSRTLHGSAPDDSPVALRITDAINDFAFAGGRRRQEGIGCP